MRDATTPPTYDCLIIGAGQAGLAAGRLAQRAGLSFEVLEASEEAGAEWRRRAPDHTLFTPRSLSKLPGLDLYEGPQEGYPTNAEMGRYLAAYARTFELPLRTGARVVELARSAQVFTIGLHNGIRLKARTVVLANGSNQEPHVPPALAAPVEQVVSQSNARDFWRNMPSAGARVLVVGDGASGRHAALDFAEAGHSVVLAGRNRRLAPARILGRSLFYWLMKLRFLRADRDTLRARVVAHLNPVPNRKGLGDPRLRKADVDIRPELVETRPEAQDEGAAAGLATFGDGTTTTFDHVVWCIGYKEATEFNTLAPGAPAEWYTEGSGRTPEPGLFVTGRVWLFSRASELLLGAPLDAQRVMDAVLAYLDAHPHAIDVEAVVAMSKEQRYA